MKKSNNNLAAPFDDEHRNISLRQNAFRVLSLLVQFQKRTKRGSFEDGLIWTTIMIAHHMTLNAEVTENALLWLVKRGHVEKRGGEWCTTETAAEALSDEINFIAIQSGSAVQEFRTEALTGMDREGIQTRLTNAALPSPVTHGRENDAEKRVMAQCALAQRVRSVALAAGIDFNSAADGLMSGRVRRCTGTNGVRHYGMFHRHNGKNGKRWQSLCIECRKRLRGRKKV